MTLEESDRDLAEFVRATDLRLAQFLEVCGTKHKITSVSAKRRYELIENGDETTVILDGLAFSVVRTRSGFPSEFLIRRITGDKPVLYQTVMGDDYTIDRKGMEEMVLPMIDKLMVLDDLGRV